MINILTCPNRMSFTACRMSDPGHIPSGAGLHQHPNPYNQQQSHQLPRLLPEEERILKECQRESFYYRSAPYAALLSMGAYSAVRVGYLRPSPRFGPVPKVILAGILGHIAGKFSYTTACADKFLAQAPDSNIAEAIRRRRGLPPRSQDERLQEERDIPTEALTQPERSEAILEGSVPQVVPATPDTYEELRRQNRTRAEPRGFGHPPPPPSSSSSPPPCRRGQTVTRIQAYTTLA